MQKAQRLWSEKVYDRVFSALCDTLEIDESQRVNLPHLREQVDKMLALVTGLNEATEDIAARIKTAWPTGNNTPIHYLVLQDRIDLALELVGASLGTPITVVEIDKRNVKKRIAPASNGVAIGPELG